MGLVGITASQLEGDGRRLVEGVVMARGEIICLNAKSSNSETRRSSWGSILTHQPESGIRNLASGSRNPDTPNPKQRDAAEQLGFDPVARDG